MAKRFRKHRPTVRDGAIALQDHVAAVASLARDRYGPRVDGSAIRRMLEDRDIVRYPVAIVFDDQPLHPGEFAFAEPRGCGPQEGFTLFVHPYFQEQTDTLPMLIAYQLVRVNYGDVASHEEAEAFGAALFDMDRDEYYERICDLADSMPAQ